MSTSKYWQHREDAAIVLERVRPVLTVVVQVRETPVDVGI
jgi:hypothetical protein